MCIHEDALKIGSAVKAPDYCFRIGGTRKFFVEAKKPSVNLKEDISPAFQLRRYAWSAKLPLSILTDFEEFAVYDCRVKPVKTDKASTARVLYMTYKEYVQRWDEISSVFTRDAVLKGSFDKYAEKGRHKKGTAEVDAAFLSEIESWRDTLARNIALRNEGLTQRELNFSVQRTIDRIIFLRICEDRGIEEYGRLMALLNGANVYKRLFQIFRNADERYNSGLFHFEKEKGRHEFPDDLTPSLDIDDKLLKEMIGRLYYPESPYEFSVLPADILGQVYEQFLGKVIRLTEGHRAVVEEKPEVRKAGGVYYTPTYIVDYIVKNTVGHLLGMDTAASSIPTLGKGGKGGFVSTNITPKEVSKIRILDPACGSGSFLLGAYQYLLDWHRDWYSNNDPQKWAIGKHPALYQAEGGDWHLTTAERKRILLNNIYGVDIDSQAVEVTKLSLLLKVLEGENNQTLERQMKFFHERALPDLGDNIKCGNSLIGPDFYSQQTMLDEEERYRINVFDWNTEFPQIMKAGGFDAVIGNPPYVRQEGLGDFKKYFQINYKVYHGTADLYAYFIEGSHKLLRQSGLFGMICSNKWMKANYGKSLRLFMETETSIIKIVDFGELPVFESASTFPSIILTSKSKTEHQRFIHASIKHLDFQSLQDEVQTIGDELDSRALQGSNWTLAGNVEVDIFEKMRATGVPLDKYIKGKIYYGLKTGLNKAFVIDRETKDKLIAEDPKSAEVIKPFVVGDDVRKYHINYCDRFLILLSKGWTRAQIKSDSTSPSPVIPASEARRESFRTADSGQAGMTEKKAWQWLSEAYPAVARHLTPHEAKGKERYDKGEYWWELRACDYYADFEKPKIIYPIICEGATFFLR